MKLATLADAAEKTENATTNAVAPARPLYTALRTTFSVRNALDALVRLKSVSVLEEATQSLEFLAIGLEVSYPTLEALDVLVALDNDGVLTPVEMERRLGGLCHRAQDATDTLCGTVLQ